MASLPSPLARESEPDTVCAKTRDLYADLGLASQRVTRYEIRVAYEKLALKLAPDKNPRPGSNDAVRFSKACPPLLPISQPLPRSPCSYSSQIGQMVMVQSAYSILDHPVKRAEYDQSRARVQNGILSTPKSTCSPRQNLPLDEQFRAARGQLQQQIWQRARARRAPPRARLGVKARLRAHARRIAQLQPDAQAQLLWDTVFPAGVVGSDDEFERVWASLGQGPEPAEAAVGDSPRREEEEREAVARQAAEREAELGEEEAAREQAAAARARARAEDVEFINQEAEDSIAILAGMRERPAAPPAIGYARMLHDDYVRRLVERTDDLLEYLWDKVHSGDWVCPEVRGAIDLDRLLGLVLQRHAQESYFPSATQDLATSLLRKWRGEGCDEADDDASPAQETDSQPCSGSGSDPDPESESSDGESTSEEGEGEELSGAADLQCTVYPQAAEPQHSPLAQHSQRPPQYAQNMQQRSPFAKNTPQTSPFAHKAQQKSPFALGRQQYNTGAEMSAAGWKRVRSPDPDPYGAQETQRSKRQKHAGHV